MQEVPEGAKANDNDSNDLTSGVAPEGENPDESDEANTDKALSTPSPVQDQTNVGESKEHEENGSSNAMMGGNESTMAAEAKNNSTEDDAFDVESSTEAAAPESSPSNPDDSEKVRYMMMLISMILPSIST